MDYKTALLNPISKLYIDGIAATVLLNPSDFEILFQYVFDKDTKVAWRAAWACHKISEKQPQLFTKSHITQLIQHVLENQHDGVLRGCLSVLNQLDFYSEIHVAFINICYERMLSPHYSIAVQALSMKLLHKICTYEPELLPELLTYLRHIDVNGYSKGFQSVRNKILRQHN